MIKTNIRLEIGYATDDLYSAITKKLPIERSELSDVTVVRRTLNLKDKGDIHYDATVAFSLSDEREAHLLKLRRHVFSHDPTRFSPPTSHLPERPVVIGAGPAGLFAALTLALAGARPILYERGLSVDERRRKVDTFTRLGILDPECNVQFGEGGAGTYSDGKLKSGAHDKYKLFILDEFISAGAPADILFSGTAHVGTDKLSDVIRTVREKIISLGGEVHFGARLTSLKVQSNRLVGGRVEKNGEISDFSATDLVLATGHSACDVFELLLTLGAPLEPRPFGIGVRIEHPREYINDLVYGHRHDQSLETASYHLVTHLPTGRSVYSFCMCPGGTVVAAASESGGIVTNGMSEYLRDGDNSNAALLVSVTPDDFGRDSPLAGIDLQRRIERRAFDLEGGYIAPSERLLDLTENAKSATRGGVNPSYSRGTVPHLTDEYLPDFITDSLRAAISDFDAWMPGYNYPDAALTGPETRTTSPVRVLRTDSYETLGISGLYPAGEGAGYAGGIISSARDGVLVAEAILNKYSKEK